MKIITVVGARPQLIKASVVSRLIREMDNVTEILVHTGQHFQFNMSDIFFKQLGIPVPNYNLGIGGGRHGQMVGRMLEQLEIIMLDESPDVLLVYGDTNSTLAASLAASKIDLPIAHVEAGVRSFDKSMPEEINRILIDKLADYLFCPTPTAVKNLTNEGISFPQCNVHNVGDIMLDSALWAMRHAKPPEDFLSNITPFIFVTIHRAENTDNLERLREIVIGLNSLSSLYRVVFPLHPRTKKALDSLDVKLNIEVIEPIGYFESLWLIKECALVLTDSGGLQKEAYFLNKPCATIRSTTEWPELLENGANVLIDANAESILSTVGSRYEMVIDFDSKLFGCGDAGKDLLSILNC